MLAAHDGPEYPGDLGDIVGRPRARLGRIVDRAAIARIHLDPSRVVGDIVVLGDEGRAIDRVVDVAAGARVRLDLDLVNRAHGLVGAGPSADFFVIEILDPRLGRVETEIGRHDRAGLVGDRLDVAVLHDLLVQHRDLRGRGELRLLDRHRASGNEQDRQNGDQWNKGPESSHHRSSLSWRDNQRMCLPPLYHESIKKQPSKLG